MSKVIIKGGVWLNTEDEILKAAIMKYGKNQWARISSLLNRKSPKQCKARWYEWLDPSIKKTEWTKGEDEKLLHLAKLMPTQWRTIAPIVGRTATQCLDRYQRLLDDAEQRDGDAGENAPTADDIRRLRPGEIDPEPETRPARPDPIDMDEDEKEMLSEARARLANTQGKKAKRKARERQLEETRRMASTQKRREAKAAGIGFKFRVKKGQLNYNAEIPFQVRAPAGFFDITEEKNRAFTPQLTGRSVGELEVKTRSQQEQLENKEENRRKRAAKEKGQGDSTQTELRQLEEVETFSKRRRLELPAPQIGDQELDALVKMSESGSSMRDAEDQSVTKGLLPDYERKLTATGRTLLPGRTPAVPDFLQTEASNLLKLTNSQTPLFGGQNVTLADGGTGFQGATPVAQAVATPNIFASGLTPRHPSGNQTPQGVVNARNTPFRTPLRDSFNINDDRNNFGFEERRVESYVDPQVQIKHSVMAGLSALPAPKNEFDIIVPDDDDDAEDAANNVTEVDIDMADAEVLHARQQTDVEINRLARRSTVLQRQLPRPFSVVDLQTYQGSEAISQTYSDNARNLIATEMLKVVAHEFSEEPPVIILASNDFDDDTEQLVVIDDEFLQRARQLVQDQLTQLKETELSRDEYHAEQNSWQLVQDGQSVRSVHMSKAKQSDLLQTAKVQFHLQNETSKRLSERTRSLQDTVQRMAKPFLDKQAKTHQEIEKAWEKLDSKLLQLDTFTRLLEHETTVAIPHRLESKAHELAVVRKVESEWQINYKEMIKSKSVE